MFHEGLARGEGDLYEVRTLDELRGAASSVNKGDVLEDWKRILKVNYWPIFDIARRILEVIPADTSRPLLERLVTTATELVANHMMRSHDLTGAVFQRLIADRKFLAAYYTDPSSAALLAGLLVIRRTLDFTSQTLFLANALELLQCALYRIVLPYHDLSQLISPRFVISREMRSYTAPVEYKC